MSYTLPFSGNCPCQLNQDQLERFDKLDSNLDCQAQWADGSKRICGKPLGAHYIRGSIPLFLYFNIIINHNINYKQLYD